LLGPEKLPSDAKPEAFEQVSSIAILLKGKKNKGKNGRSSNLQSIHFPLSGNPYFAPGIAQKFSTKEIIC
jgi:hypothetical protein